MTRAVFLDALGTLVELEPPLVPARARSREVSDERLVAAVRKEMAFYREHAHEGRDPESLADLRERCAKVLSAELGVEIGAAELVEAVRLAISLTPSPRRCAARPRPEAIVVSNWDCSLGDVLEGCGLSPLLDGRSPRRKPATASRTRGSSPPPSSWPGEPAEALHVGDSPVEDGDGARAAGVPVL